MRARNPNYNWYRNNRKNNYGWSNGTSYGRTYNHLNNNRRQYDYTAHSKYSNRVRRDYGYGYRRPSTFKKVVLGAGVLTGKLIKSAGTLAKKSFIKSKEFTDSVKTRHDDKVSNIFYSENAEFNDVSFDQNDMIEILDVPANSVMCATETGVKLVKHCADVLMSNEES